MHLMLNTMLDNVSVVLVLFAATLSSSTFGFGGALLAMPLLTLVAGLKTALPLYGLVSVATALLITGFSWRDVKLNQVWRLVLATLAGIPVGVALVRWLPQELMVLGLGLFLIGFGSYRLLRAPLPQISHPIWGFPFGFAAGILGGAYNVKGPPVIIYGMMNRWSPGNLRATMQSYLLPTGLGVTVSHGLGGLLNGTILGLFLLAMPAVLVAIGLGGWLNRRLPVARFEQLVFIIFIGLGLLLIRD